MQLDYSQLLDNIKRRRFDEAIRDHVLSPSFSDENIPAPVRYALEAMQELDTSYAYKVFANARRIQEAVTKELRAAKINTSVRYQGALRIETHIRLYGEMDLLFIMDESATHKDVFRLGQLLREYASKQNFQRAEYGDGVRVQIVTQKPACRINLIPCAWFNNPQYVESKMEIYRGIVVYNFKDKTRKKHLPFLNMARMNAKDQATMGSYKKAMRLLKSLCTDTSVQLNAYELGGLLYKIDDTLLIRSQGEELALLPVVHQHVAQLVNDKQSFELLLAPSDKELVFGNKKGKREAVAKMLEALDQLITDLKPYADEGLTKRFDYQG